MKTPLSRRIFFWTLVVSYIATTSIVLLFVFGYRHDFTKKIFVYTGSLTIKPIPKEVTIKLNGKSPRARFVNIINDSYFISGLRPEKYDITVSREGFKQWHKEASVHSGVSTEFWNIFLIRDTYERTPFTITDIDQFFPAPMENIFACTHQMGKTFTVRVFDTKKDHSSSVFIFPKAIFTRNEHENIEWSPNSKKIIIPIVHIDKEQKKDYVLADTRTNTTSLFSDIIDFDNINMVRWAPKERDIIYFLSDNTLWRSEILFDETRNTPNKIATDVIAYDFADDGIYMLTTQGEILYDHDIHGRNARKLTTFDINQSHKNFRLIAYDNRRVIALDDTSADLFLYNKGEKNIYTKKLGTNIVGAHFSDDGKKLLFYSPFEIFVYFTRDWDTQPLRKENQQQSVIRFSQFIDNVQFAKDYEHVIFTVEKSIKITELDYRGNRITETITPLSEEKTTLISRNKSNHLFFLDDIQNKKRVLQSITFPEKQNLF